MHDYLVFDHLTKRYGALKAVDDVSLSIEQGSIFSLLGPSGCGKTTLLRMIAGFEKPDSGRILLNGRDITQLPPNQRQVNTIFQNYALFPHLSVCENIAFGLKVTGHRKADIERETLRMLELVQLERHADSKVTELSGGQKQRTAIARALIKKPNILLLDEPLAALDLKLRQRMLMELDLLHDEIGITFLYVTHDQSEAMSLSDKIAVMNEGHIEQVGTPSQIYEAPCSSFVAAFIGDTNFFDGAVIEVKDSEYCTVRIGGFGDVLCYNDKKLRVGNPVHLSIRPEKFAISRNLPEQRKGRNVLSVTVDDIVYLGTHTKYWVLLNDYRVEINQQHMRYQLDQIPIKHNEQVWLYWNADDGYMLERYCEDDEEMVFQPPEEIGDNPEPTEQHNEEE
ncbi:MAG: ABC transporter ATP-binding protein [Kiritimatiellae bacterium]|nr:ABC transporter ATP-binding protein [Kiritimatiellia bacterium]